MPTGINLLKPSRSTPSSQNSNSINASHHGLGKARQIKRLEAPGRSGAQEALLVGPADCYQLGDLLRPHVLARAIELERYRCAGLVNRDWKDEGGHPVKNYGECALEMTGNSLHLIHLGGDSLTQTAVEGYRKAANPVEAERFESLSQITPEKELSRYVKRRSGQLGELAYVLEPKGEFFGAKTSFHAVGLSSPEKLAPAEKERLFQILRETEFLGVRDETGVNFFTDAGFEVTPMPCPLSVLPQLCATKLSQHQNSRALEEVRNRFPNGWIAVEVGGIPEAERKRLVEALQFAAEKQSLGLVFFDASGVSREVTREWAGHFPEWMSGTFSSRNIWEVASMLLHSRLYCGTSLDCRIIAMAGGVARINVPCGDPSVLSYAELWEHDDVPIEFSADEDWAAAIQEALEVDLSALQRHAVKLQKQYADALRKFCAACGLEEKNEGAMKQVEIGFASGLHHLRDEWLESAASIGIERRPKSRGRAVRAVRELLKWNSREPRPA